MFISWAICSYINESPYLVFCSRKKRIKKGFQVHLQKPSKNKIGDQAAPSPQTVEITQFSEWMSEGVEKKAETPETYVETTE